VQGPSWAGADETASILTRRLQTRGYKWRVVPAVSRFCWALLVAALVVVLASGGAAGRAAGSAPEATAYARAFDGQAGPTRVNRAALAAVTWRGGSTTASTGEVVEVFVSNALPAETPEKWAEFIAKLTQGPELAQLTARIATLAEVEELCGTRALGCYGQDEMISLGEPTLEGTTPEEVVRHEYGHHVAAHRLNTPWQAIDWGPKHWASAATICSRVARKEAFPGDGGRNYAQNPGEAWAEVYRLMDERKAGVATGRWPIVSRSFFPNEAALQAAERDVLQPWAAGKKAVSRRTFGKKTKKVWWIRLSTPLDGDLALTATVPRGGLHEVALVAANRKTVLKRAQWVGQRTKRTATTVCGQRSLYVRVTQSGALGRVTVSVATP
jgi:hypothetical protein